MAQVPVKFKIEIDGAKIRRTMRRSLIAAGIPLHRADVPVDSCSAIFRWPHGPGMEPCHMRSGGKHRADSPARVAAEQDER